MASTSHNLSFVACISRFFAVFAEFEAFVLYSHQPFYFSPFDVNLVTHAYAFVGYEA